MDTAGAQDQAHTVERFNPAGPLGTDIQLQCPNPQCADGTKLILIESANVETPASFYDVGVTWPEIERDEDETIATQIPQRKIVGWRCGNCRTGFTGENPLSRLARPS